MAAGAVVTRDVPPYTVVAGNPAVLLREFSPDARLMQKYHPGKTP